MRIYLAAPYRRRDEMRIYAEVLRQRGHLITSRWIGETHEDNGIDGVASDAIEFNRKCALEDLEDIQSSDTMIFFSEPPNSPYSRGGRHFELGYAHAQGDISLIVIGYRENIFHALEVMNFCEDWTRALTAICELEIIDAEILSGDYQNNG